MTVCSCSTPKEKAEFQHGNSASEQNKGFELDLSCVFFRCFRLKFWPWAAATFFSILRWRTTEAAFASTLWTTTRATFTTRTTPRAARTTLGSTHHVAHALHPGLHLFFGQFAIFVCIGSGKTTFDLLLGKLDIFFFCHIAVTVFVHAAKDFIDHDRSARRAAFRTTTTFRRCRAFSIRLRGTFRRTTKTTFAAFTFAIWATTHPFTHFFCDGGHLGSIHKAVAIGIHTGKPLITTTTGESAKLFFADLPVAIYIRSLQEFAETVPAALVSWRRAFGCPLLSKDQTGAHGEQTQEIKRFIL